MIRIRSAWRPGFVALWWGGLGLLTAFGMVYTRKNLRALETRAQSQYYGVGETMIPTHLLSTSASTWWVVLSPRLLTTRRDSTSCSKVVHDATATQARVLMLGTCSETERPLVLSPDDTARTRSALLMMQRAKLAAIIVSPDGGYVFGTRKLTDDSLPLRAVLPRAR